MPIMQRIQFDISYDEYLRLLRHPDCPGWRGRNKFFQQMMSAQINSAEFKLRESENEKMRITRERDRAKRELDFQKKLQSGELFRSLASKPEPQSPTAPSVQIETQTESVH